MATLMSLGGNFATAASWAVCDSTAESDSEANSRTVGTTNVDSATFTPGIITIDGIALKVNSNSATVGTLTVTLRNSTGSIDVTSVTVNMSDIPTTAVGWYLFKFSASQTILGATNYIVRVVRSSATGTFSIFSSAATDASISREIRTTVNPGAAPASGDKLIITGELTGAGTNNSITITHDSTATTSYGSTSFPQSIHVSKRGTYSWSTSGSLSLYLKWAGIFQVFDGGTLNVGTSGTSINSTSTAVLEMNSASNVDTGLVFGNGSTINIYGASKTTVATLMTADKAATNTVIAVASTSGWAANDDLAFASTTRTPSQTEKKTISTVDSSTQVTLTAGGLTNAHSGTSPTQAEVINLTRNVKIRGVSNSLQGYIVAATTSVVNIQYAEFYQLGSATSGKRGIDVQTTTGTFIFKYNSIRDHGVSSSQALNITGASGQTAATFIISNNVGYNMPSSSNFVSMASTSGTWVMDSNVFMFTGLLACFSMGDMGGTFTNNVAVGAGSQSGFVFSDTNPYGTWQNNSTHSNGTFGFVIQGIVMATLTNPTAWRNNNYGLTLSGTTQKNVVIDGLVVFGSNGNIQLTGCSDILFTNAVISGDTTFSSPIGLVCDMATNIYLENCTFGVASGIKNAHTTSDITLSSYSTVFLRNCLLASTTEVASFASSTTQRNAFVASQKHDQTAGNHKIWMQYGTGSIDTAIYNTASPSLRLTPNTAGSKMESAPSGYGWTAAVANGTTLTVSIATRKSISTDSGGANYNGNQQRLIVRKNVAAGISADTVLATAAAATGVWEILSGTTAAVTDDATLEFILDCDGTAGWVNVDDFTAAASDTKTFQFWQDGVPCVSGDNTISQIKIGISDAWVVV